ncbi:PaaI family thioesterase [Mycobacterium sp. PS03-16]|uniref:PaaI family thioesterase n=1 Tax=Mycobacterium sp. PS03-16 TaxID=2559611 RepID=UPI0010733EB2|nr:PaaI family thioesterase [Mycobacterium sp. PS03-16]TFV56286.1 PaaI family thioesterase [Mycobacterium sp. PS03-16]
MSHPLNTPIGRFGITTCEGTGDTAIATLPVHGLVNPLTGLSTTAPLAMLLDHVGGLVNHLRRGPDEWTLSTELSVEVVEEAADLITADTAGVTARAWPVADKAHTALALCEFTHRDTVIGTGSVRSYYITGAEFTDHPDDPVHHEARTGLAAMMAVEPDGATALRQHADPVLNNLLGIVHGGVAANGLELVGSAALNAGRADAPLRTGSLRVNFLRKLIAGGECRYTATALRVGRNTGVAEATAVGADGQIALTARITGYR